MDCPYCGKQMNEGFIQSRGPLYFNNGKRPRAIASGDLKTINLTKASLFKAPYIKANYCKGCKKIVIELGD